MAKSGLPFLSDYLPRLPHYHHHYLDLADGTQLQVRACPGNTAISVYPQSLRSVPVSPPPSCSMIVKTSLVTAVYYSKEAVVSRLFPAGTPCCLVPYSGKNLPYSQLCDTIYLHTRTWVITKRREIVNFSLAFISL